VADAADQFFAAIAERAQGQLHPSVTGTLRIDAVDGRRTRHWLISIDKGRVHVARKNAPADMVVRGDARFLRRVFAGEANAMAAVLRGEITIAGRSDLIVLFQRLLPRPLDAKTRGVEAGYARRQA
jgi:putative sterol carrier protein